jgi:16S rRNA (uracil1498-N3)-methyltransferase
MPQFFIKASDITSGKKCIIKGEDFHHLKNVRRTKIGDLIDLRSDDGIVYKGRIREVNLDSIKAEIIERVMEVSRKTDLFLTIYISILKGKVFELALQKAVEVGVNKIIPIITERTIPTLGNKEAKKTRWQKIAENAAKQCMRKGIPVVDDILSFKEAVVNDSSGVKIIAHTEENGKNLKEYLSNKNRNEYISLMIGPEGGFSDREITLAKDNGWDQVLFGFTDLRAETASIVLPAILIYEWGDVDAGKINGTEILEE